MPLILLLLTTMTGDIDAVSVLVLGRVFVANMTGNVVFLGFAIAGVPGFDLAPSLAALLGFLAGAYVGGNFVARLAWQWRSSGWQGPSPGGRLAAPRSGRPMG